MQSIYSDIIIIIVIIVVYVVIIIIIVVTIGIEIVKLVPKRRYKVLSVEKPVNVVNESTLAPEIILTLLSLLKVSGVLPLAQNLLHLHKKKVISITFCKCK